MNGLPPWVRSLTLACAGGAALIAATRAVEATEATGRDWRAVMLAGYAGPIPDGVMVRLEVDGRLSGFAGCNRIVGRFRPIESGQVVFDRPAATFKMCQPDVMAFEDRFLKALAQDGVTGRIVGDEFLISTPGIEPLLRFR